ncbi:MULTISPECIES: Cdc6/Cdc18 family protein [unclassified Haloarcula]|uniref:Cdc6/Cdc18 family protein n=1 Tax=unclassified Haloarcula TaxID=2624677 RepID=UPI000EF1B0F9|nr:MULTISPECIES: Cdc6/Cdc18 family protein [unclassified Haloarcula]RLM34091.1 orc1/cdc6 family replication initiation protein [Haloarcula sp. Atlit-120R]RLM42334.1 orc1/cdc6 family replication initiation protein [Haloarcula sp. Atlit-47R]
MITDARALRHEFVPRDLYHREGQIDHLSSQLTPSKLDRGDHAFIFGPSGAGKTTVAKYTLGQLEAEHLGVRWAYVNGMSDNTDAAVMHKAVRDMGLGADLRREGTPTSVAVDRLRECDDQVIIILDEVSVMDERPLYVLHEIPGVSFICITTDEDEWLADLDERVYSRLSAAPVIRLEKYSHAELIDILDARVTHGLVPSRVDDTAVEFIADIAAGNAREAIALLRRAAAHVEDNEMRELTPAVVDEIADDAQREVKQRKIRALGTHQRLLFRIIRQAGEVDAGTLHARYEDQIDSPKARPTRRRYLRSLKQYDLIDDEGNGRGKSYRSLV